MKNNIALCIIATGKYPQFIEPLLNSARIHFMPLDNVAFYIFTDRIRDYGDDSVCIPTKHENWPGPTIHRYRNIVASKNLFSGSDYIFYVDVDSLFVAPVGREILSEGLTVTHHPGFYSFGTGSWETNPKSGACTKNKTRYACGGFNGGRTSVFLSLAEYAAKGIAEDERKGIVAVYHDESWLNMIVNDFMVSATHWLDPSYMMVEEPEKRKLWRIDHFTPRIIALAKDHKAIRS